MSRKPVTAKSTGRPVRLIITEEPGEMLYYDDGRPPQIAATVAFEDPDDMGRMRAGYICAQCFEDLDVPFPDHCPVCGFAMRDDQAEYIAKRFVGDVWVGPQTSIEDEKAIMLEMRERAYRERDKNDILVAKPQIIVPRGFSA